MKVELLIEGLDDKTDWRDMYIDETKISGFYPPDHEENQEPSLNIILDGNMITVKQTAKLLDYLTEKLII